MYRLAHLLAVLLMLPTLAVLSSVPASAATVLTPLEAIERAEHRFHVLHDDARDGDALERWTDLVAIARDWSRYQTANDLGHNPDLARLACCSRKVRENVGQTSAFGEELTDRLVDKMVDEIMRAWLVSAPHSANIHDADFDQLGIGVTLRRERSEGVTVWRLVATADFRAWDGGARRPPGHVEVHGPVARAVENICAGSSSAGFADTRGTVHEALIDCAIDHGLSNGVDDDTFLPAGLLTRAQGATFVTRLLDAAGAALPPATRDHFVDDNGSVHEDAINRLADAGLLRTTSHWFRPAAAMSRGDLAVLTARGLEYLGALDAEGTAPWFADLGLLPASERLLIQALADAGVVAGTDVGRFSPTRSVTRAQMAVTMVRALDAAMA